MKALILIPLLGLLLSSPALSAAPEIPTPTIEASSRSRDRFYEVRGVTAAEVFSSIGKQKLGNIPGRSASGLTESKLSYSLESTYGGNKPCRVLSLKLDLNLVITLPRHASSRNLDPDAQRNWEIYETAVEAHEYRHVEIELRGLEELTQRLRRGITDGKITAAGQSACANYVDELLRQQRSLTKRRHEDFHVEASQEVRDLQAAGRARLDTFDEQLERDQRALNELAEMIGEVRDEYDDLLESIPLSAPGLRADSWSIARELAEELNAAIDRHHVLREELQGQLEARKRLVEDLQWIR